MNIIDTIPKIEWLSLKTYKDDTKSVLITSQSVRLLAQEFLSGISFAETILINSSTEEYILSFPKPLSMVKRLYAFGGGRVIDLARLYASTWQLDFIAIPTIISSDAFLVNCTGVRKNGCVSYLPSNHAQSIFMDWDLLKKTPIKYHVSGCSDVLSIFTGLHDWKLANNNKVALEDEIYNKSVDLMAQGILDGLMSMNKEIKAGSYPGIKAIITTLAMEVQLCYFYGNSRPEEGGEHFFTYCIENKLPHFLHGEMVAFGILLTGYLQKQDISSIKKFMDQISLNYLPEGLTQAIVKETLRELPQYVLKHNLRFSIYDNFNIAEKSSDLRDFFSKINVKE